MFRQLFLGYSMPVFKAFAFEQAIDGIERFGQAIGRRLGSVLWGRGQNQEGRWFEDQGARRVRHASFHVRLEGDYGAASGEAQTALGRSALSALSWLRSNIAHVFYPVKRS